MNRMLQSAALGLAAVVAALSVPAAAAAQGAAAADGTITAFTDHVALTGDPWHAAATTDVVVRNEGVEAAAGFFLLRLPQGTELGATDSCDPATKGDIRNWLCGGDQIPSEGSRTYKIRITARADDPEFGVQRYASVAGRTVDGKLTQRSEFRITWPDRTKLRLAATKVSTATSGTAKVSVTVTNAGTFAITGYSLHVDTDTDMTVTSKVCEGLPSAAGPCRIDRMRRLDAGSADTFMITLALAPGDAAQQVRLLLTPSARYTNAGTEATLSWAARPVTVASSPAPSTAPTVPGPGGVGGGTPVDAGATLPVALPVNDPRGLPENAAEISFLVAGGSALLGLATLIVVLPWRRTGR